MEFLFHYEKQLHPLLDQNKSGTELPPYLKFVSIAEKDKAPLYMRHHLCAVACATPSAELINDEPPIPSTPYAMKGADVGSACPPRCGGLYAKFPVTGIPLRESCKPPEGVSDQGAWTE